MTYGIFKGELNFPFGNGSSLKGKWGKNTAGRFNRRMDGLAAADQVSVCWSSDFNCPSLYIHTPT